MTAAPRDATSSMVSEEQHADYTRYKLAVENATQQLEQQVYSAWEAGGGRNKGLLLLYNLVQSNDPLQEGQYGDVESAIGMLNSGGMSIPGAIMGAWLRSGRVFMNEALVDLNEVTLSAVGDQAVTNPQFGYTAISNGFLRTLDSPEGLAWGLAHEAAHENNYLEERNTGIHDIDEALANKYACRWSFYARKCP